MLKNTQFLALAKLLAVGMMGLSALPCSAMPAAGSGSTVFIENKGQWDSRALFLARFGGQNLWVTQEGPVFDFHQFVRGANGSDKHSGSNRGQVVKMSFVKAQLTAVSGRGQQPGLYNYFIGSDRSKWGTNARAFSEAVAEQPYSGMSVRYSAEQGSPRYDIYVKPGADPSQVGMKIEGADGVQLSPDGSLLLSTSLGTVEEHGLIAYQETASGRTRVPCRMVADGNVVHFDVGSYDTSRTLVIDPLVHSSYISGGGGDSPSAVGLDSSNNVYVAGTTQTADFPTTVGAYQRTGVANDTGLAFLSKLNPSESTLIYSTFLGGSDEINALAVDSAGEVTVTGSTWSDSFPVTVGAYQTLNNAYDSFSRNTGFVTKINPTGSGLTYSTLLGGSGGNGGDVALCLAIDASGAATVGGYTASTDFPTTSGAVQRIDKVGIPGFEVTGFVTRLNPTGTALEFSTYLGGSGDSTSERQYYLADSVACLSVDGSGNTTVAGQTTSSDFPVTPGAFQSNNQASGLDLGTGFVARINPTGTQLAFSTYFGGSKGGGINCMALDKAGDVFVGGLTESNDFPVTIGALRKAFSSQSSTGFVSELNSTGSALIFSTFLGGTNQDAVDCLTLNSAGNPVVGGTTGSTNFPVTVGALHTVHADTNQIGFVSEFGPAGASLVYSTYLGGTGGDDGCTSVALNTNGQAVVTGHTNSLDFPTTAGAFQTSISPFNFANYYYTGFLSTLGLVAGAGGLADFAVNPSPVVGGNSVTGVITLLNSATADTVFHMSQPSGITVPLTVTVLKGKASQEFSISTQAVTAPVSRTITATAGTQSISATLVVVVSIPAISSLTLTPSSVLGGDSSDGIVNLPSPPEYSGANITITSNNPHAIVQNSFRIDPGQSFNSFPITTTAVTAATLATITASYGGAVLSQTLTITPPGLGNFFLSPSSVVGGTNSDGLVSLPAPAIGSGTIVQISSNSPDAIVQPALRIAAGKTFNSFPIKTKAVITSTQVTITVTYGSSVIHRTLTLTP